MRYLLTALAVCTSLSAQAPDRVPPSPEMTRSIVMFEKRPFDLSQLRAAILGDYGKVRVDAIVADLEARAAEDQRAFADRLEEYGGVVRQHFWLINGCSVLIPPGVVELIEELPNVAGVYESSMRTPQAATSAPLPILTATNSQNHNVDQLQAQGILGDGVTVAYLDTSFDSDMGGLGRPHQTFFVNGDPNNTTGGGISGSRLLTNTQVGIEPADSFDNHGTKVAAVGIGEVWNVPGIADKGHAPAAKIAGYAIADMPNGLSEVQTMVAAWQQTVADIPTYGTSVAVMAYDGTQNVLHPEQQAIDAAAWVGDLLITLSGGTTLPLTPSVFYHAATNALACGAADFDVHTVPTWTAFGPLLDGRGYPHIVANGNGVACPEIDNEAAWTWNAGTSYSCSQVGGAAALFRSLATTATADQTRAALLATTEDISQLAPENQIGAGYLRDDRLVSIAQGSGLSVADSVDLFTPTKVFSFPVQAHQTYAVALCWSRQIVSQTNWANLDLRVLQDGLELATSTSAKDTNERVVFRANTNSPVQIVVERVSLEGQTISQPFGLVAAEAPDAVVPGRVTSYGFGCPSAPDGIPSSNSNVMPALQGFDVGFGGAGATSILGPGPSRIQLLLDPQQFATDGYAIGFRFDDSSPFQPNLQWIELEIDIGPSDVNPVGANATFASNLSNVVLPVVSRRQVVLPPVTTAGNPTDWQLVIPFDQAISTFPDFSSLLSALPGAGSLLVDIRIYATSSGGITWPVDATVNGSGSTVVAGSPTATTGVVNTNLAPIISILTVPLPELTPSLSWSGIPDAGETLTLELDNVPPNAGVGLVTGLSRTTWAGAPLPIDMSPLGAPGCFVLAALELPVFGIADPNGTIALSIPLPNGTQLVGVPLYEQAIVFDATANVFGLTFSNALEIIIGGR